MVRMLSFKEDAMWIKSDGLHYPVCYMVLELMTGRDIFDFINCGGGFQEKTVRFYFNQMLQAMHYIHSMGICHRDLKPANIMLDDQFNIRIADFGFATTIKGNGSGLL